ncbi:MAG: carotenoid oxygenase family protein [Pseudomonadota bacterium]
MNNDENLFTTYQKKLSGINTPVETELHQISLAITGKIPKEIYGHYYRNGPNQKYIPGAYHHLIDGNGMIHQFSFNQGEIIYTNRWVRNKLFISEEKENRCLTSCNLKTGVDKKILNFSSRERTRSNTHAIVVGGTLLAFEENGIPYQLSTNDLSTLGVLQEAVKYKTTVTGHPKYDKIEKKIYCLNWNLESHYPACTVFWLNETLNIVGFSEISVPYRAFIHDYAITENYILLPLFPCIAKEESMSHFNHSTLSWQPTLPTKIGVIDKRTLQVIHWFEIEGCYALHTCNAYEKNGKIYFTLICHDHPTLLANENLNSNMRSQLTTIILDITNNTANFTLLDAPNFCYHFPRIDDRKLGRYCDVIYACLTQNTTSEGMLYSESLIKINIYTGEKQIYTHGAGWYFNEPVFVPGQTSNYLIAIVTSTEENLSFLLLFNENDITCGPIASALLPHRIPYGFHGSWSEV